MPCWGDTQGYGGINEEQGIVNAWANALTKRKIIVGVTGSIQ